MNTNLATKLTSVATKKMTKEKPNKFTYKIRDTKDILEEIKTKINKYMNLGLSFLDLSSNEMKTIRSLKNYQWGYQYFLNSERIVEVEYSYILNQIEEALTGIIVTKKEIKDKLIGEALYVINKEGKKERDAKEEYFIKKGYEGSHHANILNRFRNNKESTNIYQKIKDYDLKIKEIYEIKDKILWLLMAKKDLKAVGFHEFAGAKFYPMFEFGGFTFHSKSHKYQSLRKELPNLGKIVELISSEKKSKISYKRALSILNQLN